jgi:hypothetical protein
LSPLATVATNRPTVPAPGDYDDGEIGGMIEVLGESLPHCRFIYNKPHLLRTRAAAVESLRLTTRATARSSA